MDNSKAKRVLGFAPRYNNAAECARFLLPMPPFCSNAFGRYVPALMASAYPTGVAEFQ
jgi:hypothetical protein